MQNSRLGPHHGPKLTNRASSSNNNVNTDSNTNDSKTLRLVFCLFDFGIWNLELEQLLLSTNYKICFHLWRKKEFIDGGFNLGWALGVLLGYDLSK